MLQLAGQQNHGSTKLNTYENNSQQEHTKFPQIIRFFDVQLHNPFFVCRLFSFEQDFVELLCDIRFTYS